MTRLFDFPKMWGKLGAWPGIMTVNAAQAVMQRAAQLPKGSRIVQLGFDGGRTTIVLGWAAKEHGHSVHVIGSPSADPQMELWFKRATLLFMLNDIVMRNPNYEPYAADIVVAGSWSDAVRQWTDKIKPGGACILLGEATTIKQEGLIANATLAIHLPHQIAMWEKQAQEELPQSPNIKLNGDSEPKSIMPIPPSIPRVAKKNKRTASDKQEQKAES